jgi:L-threonylcarbamoyladenylate synthase
MILPDNEGARQHAAGVIAEGGLIAFRTDTFYGLGADPFDARAVARIKQLKGRESTKPILLLIADETTLERLISERSKTFARLATGLWPGPLTLIGAARETLPRAITAGTGTVGVRLPDDESVRNLVRQCGGVLTATSANRSGHEPSRSALQVMEYFPDALDLIIDAGDVTATAPSTVIDTTSTPPCVVREGAIARQQIDGILSQECADL